MLRSSRRSEGATPDARLEASLRENARLRELLAEKASRGAAKSGYLNKYRAQAEQSLWAATWENRFVIVRGSTLTYYRSEQDVQFPARGSIDLQGTYVEAEGLKRRKFWTFNILDRAGVSLIRLSTEVEKDFLAWMEVLEHAGCMPRREEETSHRGGDSSPQPSSPATSAVSDSGNAADRGGQEADSRHVGYTSDQSDITKKRPARAHRRADPMPASAPVHTSSRFSLLSSERIKFSNQSGLLTLALIILAATNFRLILENSLKYGFRFNPITFVRYALTPRGNLLLLLCWPALAVFVALAYWIERLGVELLSWDKQAADAAKKKGLAPRERAQRRSVAAKVTENIMFWLNALNTTAAMAVPFAVIHFTKAEPLPGFALTMATCVLWLKLVSYAHVNYDYRWARREHKIRPGERGSPDLPENLEVVLRYPENITLGNLAYFVSAPTLCYQPSYPRSRRRRLRWLARKLGQLTLALGLMLFFMEQYIEPTIANSLEPLQSMDWLRMFERVLKLSLPTLYYWLAMFYVLFDLWLNIVAEYTRFDDREFYKEWWNATTVGEYWRLWNMPVHKWVLRHVYFPCIRRGIPSFGAGIVVFFVSAVFHEVLVGVPLHMLRFWSFFGIMGQVPLMMVTEYLKRKFKSDRVGNVIFWVTFCVVGQPLALMLYYHDWRKLHAQP